MPIEQVIRQILVHLDIPTRDKKYQTLFKALEKAASLGYGDSLRKLLSGKRKNSLELSRLLKWLSQEAVLDGEVTEEFLEDPKDTDSELASFIELSSGDSSGDADDGWGDDTDDGWDDLDEPSESKVSKVASTIMGIPRRLVFGIPLVLLALAALAFSQDIIAFLESAQVSASSWSLQSGSLSAELSVWLIVAVLVAGIIQLLMKGAWRSLFFLIFGLLPLLWVQTVIPSDEVFAHLALYFGTLVLSLGIGHSDGLREVTNHALENVHDLGDELGHRLAILSEDNSLVMLTEWTFGAWPVAINLFFLLFSPGVGSLAAITAPIGGTLTAVMLSFSLTFVLSVAETVRRHRLTYYKEEDRVKHKDLVSFSMAVLSGIASLVIILFVGSDLSDLRFYLMVAIVVPSLIPLMFGIKRLGEQERILDTLMDSAQYAMYALLSVGLVGGV